MSHYVIKKGSDRGNGMWEYELHAILKDAKVPQFTIVCAEIPEAYAEKATIEVDLKLTLRLHITILEERDS